RRCWHSAAARVTCALARGSSPLNQRKTPAQRHIGDLRGSTCGAMKSPRSVRRAYLGLRDELSMPRGRQLVTAGRSYADKAPSTKLTTYGTWDRARTDTRALLERLLRCARRA